MLAVAAVTIESMGVTLPEHAPLAENCDNVCVCYLWP